MNKPRIFPKSLNLRVQISKRSNLAKSLSVPLDIYVNYLNTIPSLFLPPALCRGVYSFRLSVCPFVCSYVRSFVCSFIRSYFLPSRGICVKVLR